MKVSVVIPVHNRERELIRAIKSVLGQTEQSFEILVVDDHSTVDLVPVIKNFNDERIRFFRLPAKGNANVCRNLGIKEAKGEYIAMLDSDDEWLPKHLELKMEEIAERKVDFLFGSIVANHGTTSRDVISRPLRKGEKMVNYLLTDGMAQTSTYFFKADTVKQVEWDESLDRHQDWDFIIRYVERFTYAPSFFLTCIVYWISGERKFEHFNSRQRFIDLYKRDISPAVYNDYHKKVYIGIRDRAEVSSEIKTHYYKRAMEFKQFVSLNDFLEMHDLTNSGPLYRFYLRIVFALKIILK